MLTVPAAGASSKLDYMELADRVKTARKTAGLTQEALAKRLGITRPAITQWENGTVQSLDAENAIRAARILGVDELWLASGDGHPYGVRDEAYRLPAELVDAWQRLDVESREHLMALAVSLANRKPK